MPFNLLLLPLLGGFIFIRLFRYTQYPTSRLSGQRLILWSAIASVFCLFLSRVIVVLLLKYFPQVGVYWDVFLPIPYSGTASGALFLGFVAWCPANLLFGGKKGALAWTIKPYGSQVEILFAKTFENRKQIQVTLKSGKVFAGYIIWQPLEPHKDNSYIGILPTLSGYRDTNSQQVRFTTNYVPTYKALNEGLREQEVNDKDFIKYFPMSDIRIAAMFDPDIYKNWKR